MLISVEEIPVFGMAGLYKVETDTSGSIIKRYTIITTSAGRQMSEIHDRMPVILPKDSEDIWLDSSMNNIQILKELLKPYRGNLLFKSV
jgi:putative SOS response-associated peptidase YedK